MSTVCSSRKWLPHAAAESLVDLVLVAGSPNPGRNFLNWVTDIEQLADQIKIDRFGVLGHSGGTPYALAIAFKLKDRVSKVVLASPLGQLNVPGASKTIHKSFHDFQIRIACRYL